MTLEKEMDDIIQYELGLKLNSLYSNVLIKSIKRDRNFKLLELNCNNKEYGKIEEKLLTQLLKNKYDIMINFPNAPKN